MNPTPVKCTDGKLHRWKIIASNYVKEADESWEHKWCTQCGSVTEFCNGKRCLEDDDTYCIDYPKGILPECEEEPFQIQDPAELEEVPCTQALP